MNLYEVLSENSSFAESVTPVRSSDVCPSSDSSPYWTPPIFAEVAAALGCDVCDACYLQWCTAVPGKDFYNVRFLQACPQIAPLSACSNQD